MPARPRFDRRAPERELPNINERIKYSDLRVVDSDGTQLGVISREEALEITIKRTCQLAKRQKTWFRNKHNSKWLNEENPLTEALSSIHQFLS